MPRHGSCQSGPDDSDASQSVDYEEGEALKEIDAEDGDISDLERHARRHGWKDGSSSSKQVNTVKQSVKNARAAASKTAVNNASSSSNDVDKEGLDLRLITLIRRYEKKLADVEQMKKEADAARSSKRQKSSSSSKRSTAETDSSDEESSDDDNDQHGSSNGGKGKDLTLRQDAVVNKIPTLSYVDVTVFKRDNLNIRKSKRLVPVGSVSEFHAAWASFNVELQQSLINARRSDDALMVSKYYGQLVRLLTDYSSQWKLVMELDGYIRGNPPTVGGRTVWTVDQDDDLVSGFKYDIRANHQEAFRANAALSSQRGATSQPRRVGAVGSSNNAGNKPRNLCYAYNGWNATTKEWQSVSHCRGADQCKFAHKCIHCKRDGHAVYERPECASHPRVFPTTSRR
jgi:hypothetical protein